MKILISLKFHFVPTLSIGNSYRYIKYLNNSVNVKAKTKKNVKVKNL